MTESASVAGRDIVERLRAAYLDSVQLVNGSHILKEAADEITRLRSEQKDSVSVPRERELLKRIAREMRDEHNRSDGHFSTEEVELIERLASPAVGDAHALYEQLRELGDQLKGEGCDREAEIVFHGADAAYSLDVMRRERPAPRPVPEDVFSRAYQIIADGIGHDLSTKEIVADLDSSGLLTGSAAEMRERCVKLVDDFDWYSMGMPKDISPIHIERVTGGIVELIRSLDPQEKSE